MTKFKGTKGKWKVREGYRIDIITDNDKAFGIVDFGTEQEAFLADYPIEQWKANALLISKAPEMLEMLERIVDQLSSSESLNFQSDFELIEKAEQLIKEATEL